MQKLDEKIDCKIYLYFLKSTFELFLQHGV